MMELKLKGLSSVLYATKRHMKEENIIHRNLS